jgi:hypothetical protein
MGFYFDLGANRQDKVNPAEVTTLKKPLIHRMGGFVFQTVEKTKQDVMASLFLIC